MGKIKKIIPEPIKKFLIKVHYIPEKIFLKIYRLASQGKIFVPDKIYQNWDYKIFNTKKINFKSPQSFNEKLQWMKYYYRKPEFSQLVDKYEVHKYVYEKVGEKTGDEIIVPCLGIYEKWEEIDFDKLPNEFVIKCTHDCGSVVICQDKSSFNIEKAKEKIENGLNKKQFYICREWPYKNVKPRILIEKFMHNHDHSPMIDYKFFCFNGNPTIVDVLTGRNTPEGLHEDFFDMNWKHLSVQKDRQPNSPHKVDCPPCFEQMIDIAKQLSPGFPFIRVDFVVVDNKPYFTELTFYNDGGRIPFNPESFDKWLGSLLVLPPKSR